VTVGPEGLDWWSLDTTVDGRAAIFDERFPGRLAEAIATANNPETAWEAFTPLYALGLLDTFAGAWAALGPAGGCRRFVYRALPYTPDSRDVFWFRGVELAPGQIVVETTQWVPTT